MFIHSGKCSCISSLIISPPFIFSVFSFKNSYYSNSETDSPSKKKKKNCFSRLFFLFVSLFYSCFVSSALFSNCLLAFCVRCHMFNLLKLSPLSVGSLPVLVCLGLREILGEEIFSVKTAAVLDKPGWLVTLTPGTLFW